VKLTYTVQDGYEHIHTVRFGAWGSLLRGPAEQTRKDMRNWCYTTFGSPHLDYTWHDNILFGEVMFLHQADAEMFILRWS
jgi:hypothetical protein